MGNYNIHSVNSTFNSCNTSFQGAKPYVSTPLKANEVQQTELASKEAANALRARAIAQILTSSSLKSSTTPQEYEQDLIKQGKIKDKDFSITTQNYDSFAITTITELNADGKKIKSTEFNIGKDPEKSCSYNSQSFYNPNNEDAPPYKSVWYNQNGGISIDRKRGDETITDSYEPNEDGTFNHYRNFERLMPY